MPDPESGGGDPRPSVEGSGLSPSSSWHAHAAPPLAGIEKAEGREDHFGVRVMILGPGLVQGRDHGQGVHCFSIKQIAHQFLSSSIGGYGASSSVESLTDWTGCGVRIFFFAPQAESHFIEFQHPCSVNDSVTLLSILCIVPCSNRRAAGIADHPATIRAKC